MKNRRCLYLLIGTALLASACTKSWTDLEERFISFAPVASKPTKAIIAGNTYPNSESFVVSAYHEGTAAYFEDLVASFTPSANLWTTASSQYWPLSGSLTFHAYSPAGANGVSIDATDGMTASGYTIHTPSQMTTDLCHASATVADCAAHPEYVGLTFSHALSQIVFRVKPADYYENTTLSLTSLSMDGILSVGDFTGGQWENQHTPYNYALASAPVALAYDGTTPVTTDVCAYLFLPQTLVPEAAIQVGYSITQTVSGTDYTLENPPVNISLGGSITQWEPGKKYIYTLNIGMNNVITISASAVGWSDQGYNIIVEES